MVVLCLALGLGLAVVLIRHHGEWPLERPVASLAVSIASTIGARTVPPAPASNRQLANAGRIAYTGSCASCHGPAGAGDGAFGHFTTPQAADLTADAVKDKSDEQLFWLVQNGVGFTGMPGFAEQFSAQDIWGLVAFIRQLQQGSVTALSVPEPSTSELTLADPHGDATGRGAAIYFAQNCQACHGAAGDSPGELGLRGGGAESEIAIRRGRSGMPRYDVSQVSDEQLRDLVAYLNTFRTGRNRSTR